MLGIKVGGRSLASKFRRYVRPKTSDSTAALLNWAEYNGRAPNASAALGSIAKCSGWYTWKVRLGVWLYVLDNYARGNKFTPVSLSLPQDQLMSSWCNWWTPCAYSGHRGNLRSHIDRSPAGGTKNFKCLELGLRFSLPFAAAYTDEIARHVFQVHATTYEQWSLQNSCAVASTLGWTMMIRFCRKK